LTLAGILRILEAPINMSKAQFLALNVVGGVCGLLIACDLVLGMLNGRLNAEVGQTQGQFNQAQQIQGTAQNLIMRIAQAGQVEPALRELLVRHDFKINQGTNAPAAPIP
jgi:hypothetical protein